MKKIPKKVLKAFGVTTEPGCFNNGHEDTFHCGDRVLKQVESDEEAGWIAELLISLKSQKTFSYPRPLRSVDDKWTVDKWTAWEYIPGKVLPGGRYDEQFLVCDDFHKALKDVPKPDFIDKKDNSWSIADRVAWQEIEAKYDKKFMRAIDEIQKRLRPIEVKNQLIHGDLLGNILFSKELPPAVIDYALYWRPAGFAKAIMIVDAIAWEGADVSIISFLQDREENYEELFLRAILRRIVEQPEHVTQYGKDIGAALKSVKQYQRIINII